MRIGCFGEHLVVKNEHVKFHPDEGCMKIGCARASWRRFARATGALRELGRRSRLKLVDDAGGDLRAELEGAEEMGADAVNGETNGHVAMVAVEIDSGADGSGDGALTAVRSFGSHVGSTEESVSPEVDSLGFDPADAGTDTAEGEPGIDAGLATVGGEDFGVGTDAVAIPVDEGAIKTVHVGGDAGDFVEAEEGVTGVDVVTVFLENALNGLGHGVRFGRRRRRDGRERSKWVRLRAWQRERRQIDGGGGSYAKRWSSKGNLREIILRGSRKSGEQKCAKKDRKVFHRLVPPRTKKCKEKACC